MQNVGRAPNWAYQSAVYAAQDMESKDSLMQEMQCRKGNVGTHFMRMSGVGKGKDADLGLCQDRSRTNKRDEAERGEAERDRGPWEGGWTAKEPPMNLNERYRKMGQWA